MLKLEKKDLKTLRLCCKALCAPASLFLFDTVHFSIHEEDLDAWKGFMCNPLLKGSVKTLHYDASGYSTEVTEEDYIYYLSIQLLNMTRLIGSSFRSPDQQLNKFVKASLKKEVESDEQIARYKDFEFIQRGYKNWTQRANFETGFRRENRFQKDKLCNILIDGISRFHYLESVIVHGFWDWDEGLTTRTTLPRQQSGSMVKRFWDPCQLAPYRESYLGEPSDRDLNYFDESFHYDLLNKALSMTGAKIRTFEWHDAISCSIFAEAADHELLSKKARELKIQTGTKGVPYSATRIEFARRLEVLHLEFEKEDDNIRPFFESNLLGLRLSLKAMPNLQTLDLWFPADTVIKYGQLFPTHVQWPNLTTFRINGEFQAHAHELVDLLLISMPKLRHLCVGSMVLLTGKWPGMVELLMIRGHLDSFVFYDESEFLPGGDEYDFLSFWLETEVELIDLRGAFKIFISDYLVNGRKDTRRHPCLNGNDHYADSSAYLLNLAEDWQFNDSGPETPAGYLLKSLIHEIGTLDRYYKPPGWEST